MWVLNNDIEKLHRVIDSRSEGFEEDNYIVAYRT